MYMHNFRSTAPTWIILSLICLLFLGQSLYRENKKNNGKVFFSLTVHYQWEVEVGIITEAIFSDISTLLTKEKYDGTKSTGSANLTCIVIPKTCLQIEVFCKVKQNNWIACFVSIFYDSLLVVNVLCKYELTLNRFTQ